MSSDLSPVYAPGGGLKTGVVGRRVRAALDAAYLGAAWLAGLCVLLVFVLMVGAAAFRMLGLPTRGTNDAVAWLSAAAAFLGIAHTFVHGDLVRVGLVVDGLQGRTRHAMELLALATTAAFAAYMAWWAAAGTLDSFRFGQLADGLIPMPMWIPQSSFVLGAAMFLLAVCEQLVLVALGHEPRYVTELAARHAQGDFSSDL